MCFEYDQIVPFSKGGEPVVESRQILQTRVNRFKSDKDQLDKTQLRGYSCDINFTCMCSTFKYSCNSSLQDLNILPHLPLHYVSW
ncbi:hypothetical protein Hdeb2414_s0007g00260301 [Helianthus debilis subsp. tardiflorus]